MLWFRPAKPQEELYDCEKDPHQFTNLAIDSAYQPQLERMRKAYDAWYKATGDKSETEEVAMVRNRWKGATEPPQTETPSTEKKGKYTLLKCAIPGASVAYKTGQAQTWQVYHQPLQQSVRDTLYLMAHRIGYKPSEVVKILPGSVK